MTYFGFLSIFLIIPLSLLIFLTWRDRRHGITLPSELRNWSPWVVLGAHVVVAILYTTPWDNYLVATRVWWYAPKLVTGIVWGWVPVEEYTFFVLQSLLTGLWLLFLARRFPVPVAAMSSSRNVRITATLTAGVIWLTAVGMLIAGWQPGVYLALEMVWALPPIMLQLAFGADILWRHRRLIAAALIPATLYLSAADALAINSGTWTINPELSLGIVLGGVLPLEELLFFLLTNTLLTFGMTLVLARQSQERLETFKMTTNLWPLANQHLIIRQWLLRQTAHFNHLQLGLFAAWIISLISLPIAKHLWGEAVLGWGVSVGVVLQVGLVLAILRQTWGLGRTIGATLTVVSLTWLVEAIGAATGFPFGLYHYTDKLQPQLAQVPLLIPLAWLMMLPPAWGVAYRLAGSWSGPVFVGLSALALTAWDLFLDPQMVAWGLWVWAEPGGYFGIPWQNFGGWLVTATLITVIVQPRNLPVAPLLIVYGVTWFLETFGLLFFWGLPGPALAGCLAMGGLLWLVHRRGYDQSARTRDTGHE